MLAPLLLSAVLTAPPATPKLDAAVEAAAREFRIEMYDLFREKRNEFDARRAMGNELLKAWNRAGQPAVHRDAILAWFEEARRRSHEESKLSLYVGLELLKSQIAAQESAAVAADLAGEGNISVSPPLTLDLPATNEAGAAMEKLFGRVKGLFSGLTSSEPATEPQK